LERLVQAGPVLHASFSIEKSGWRITAPVLNYSLTTKNALYTFIEWWEKYLTEGIFWCSDFVIIFLFSFCLILSSPQSSPGSALLRHDIFHEDFLCRKKKERKGVQGLRDQAGWLLLSKSRGKDCQSSKYPWLESIIPVGGCLRRIFCRWLHS